MPNMNVNAQFGSVFVEAVPVEAYKGYAGRVHTTTAAAIADVAMCELAKRWSSSAGIGAPSFERFTQLLAYDLKVTEAAIELIRFMQKNNL